jgi:hypothetical protein
MYYSGPMRTDPADNGGLFIGRRPGTGPVHYRARPEFHGSGRKRIDAALALLVLCALSVGSLLCWGPMPVACLWIGSEVDYITGNLFVGIAAAFLSLFPILFLALQGLTRLDATWIILRRAAGHDQRAGVFSRIFGAMALTGFVLFTLWLWVIHGPGSEFQSPGSPLTTW